MNPCDRYQEIIPAYVDGEATAEEKAILEAHLRNCPECRAVEKRVRQLQTALRSLPRVTTSPDFDVALRTRIRLEDRRSSVSPLPLPLFERVPAFGLMAVAAAIAFVVIVMGQARRPDTSALQAPQTSAVAQVSPAHEPVVSPTRRVQYVMDRIPAKLLQPTEGSVSIDFRHRPSQMDSAGRGENLRMLASRIYRVSF